MNRTNLGVALGIVGGALALVLGVGVWAPVAADNDDDRHYRARASDDDDGDGRHRARFQLRPEVEPAANAEYVEECGACHLAYPPALLPASSWNRMLDTLDEHFGENAELDAAVVERLRTYLEASAADRDGAWTARKLMRGVEPSAAPLRISALPYFRHEHGEIPDALVGGNPEVGSFSRCEACHQDAERGMFDEHQVRISGYGRWDD